MPSLAQVLPANDLGFLRIVASLWGIELRAPAPAQAALELAEAMLDAELMEEVIATLPKTAHQALQTVFGAGGRLPWVQFARRFGELREMGPGRRDREQPYAHPNSAAETLYYRALIGKAFFDTPSGPQEFAFIPDDLLQALEFIGFEPSPTLSTEEEPKAAADAPLLEPEYADLTEPEYTDLDEPEYADIDEILSDDAETSSVVIPTIKAKIPPVVIPTRLDSPVGVTAQGPSQSVSSLGRAATPAEKAHLRLASDRVLDDLTTVLAALRLGMEPPPLSIPLPVLHGFLVASHLISGKTLQPEAVKNFLEAPREVALAGLVEAWQSSETFNELRMLPDLAFEGVWENQPLITREFLLNLLEPIPEGVWWSIPSFLRDIKQKYPDFQRPAGDYDSWFIKRISDGQYLRGFVHWDEVDGALIRFFLQILHWLGQVDLAAPDESSAPTAFRLLSGPLPVTQSQTPRMTISSDGVLVVPRLASRSLRYQIARFCEWGRSDAEEYRYRLTPASLKRAAGQGLKVGHLVGLLSKQAGVQLPPLLARALQRWETHGTEARIETLTVLKVNRPEVLTELRSSKAARFLGEVIGPTAVVLQRGAEAKVFSALAELGLLVEVDASD